MRLPLARIVADLRGGSGRRFAALLDGHVAATIEGVELTARAARGDVGWAAARAAMAEVEHRGDALREALVVELSTAIVTPIDREDLFRISRSVDDVLDNLRDVLREADLWGIDRGQALLPMLAAIGDAADALRQAVVVIADDPRQIAVRAFVAGKAGNRIRRAYDAALAELFAGPFDVDMLKLREVLRRLDVVGLRLGEAANALSDAAMKRSAGTGRIEGG